MVTAEINKNTCLIIINLIHLITKRWWYVGNVTSLPCFKYMKIIIIIQDNKMIIVHKLYYVASTTDNVI